MVVTRSQEAKRMLRKRTKSQGSRGDKATPTMTTTTKRKKIEDMKKELSREIDKCKKFIATNLRFHNVLDSEICELDTLWDMMQSRFKKWRNNRRVRLIEILMDPNESDYGDEDAHDEEANEHLALDPDAAWIAINIEEIDDMLEERFAIERHIRPLATKVVQLVRYLMSRKMEHEELHVRLCQKLISMQLSLRHIEAKL